MAFDVNNFKTSLVNEGARPTLFEAHVYFPDDIGGASQDFAFKCKASQIPGSTIGLIEVPYMGRKIKVAGDRTFPEWTVTIINDEDYLIRRAFEAWMSGINQHVGNLRTTKTYMAQADVMQYAKDGELVQSYTFVDMWPSDISPIDLSWESNDAIEEFTVTLNYQWWEAITTDSAGGR